MKNNNSIFSSFFQQFAKKITKITKLIQKNGRKHKNIFQRFQLSFIYFFAVVVLMYTVKNSLGYFPEMLFQTFPFLTPIFDWSLLRIFATPEKTFVLYLIILEIMINRSIFNFSIVIKFNVLLIFILEMIQNLSATYWELLFIRDLDVYSTSPPAYIPRVATMVFFSVFFVIFFGLYMYAFSQSFIGRIPVFPGPLRPLTDSVAFWLQIKKISNKGDNKK
jgi:hypothetical protein